MSDADKPAKRGGQGGRRTSGAPSGRGGRGAGGPRRDGGKGGAPRGQGGPRRSGGPQGKRFSRASDTTETRAQRGGRSAAEQAIYDGPELPEEITGRELDRSIAAQLKGLPEKLANRVARHMVAAGVLIESDPETAYRHTLAARARAPRLAVVREAAGEAAYAAGHYAEALSDLRAAKRMNGATAYLPIMADCQRAIGKPEEALRLAKSPSVAGFPAPAKAEMTLVEAGARRDLGQVDAALRILELAPLNSQSREPWVVRLRYAYADALVEAGRPQDALAWFHRTHAIDGDDLTDAAARAATLEKELGTDG